MLRLRRGRQGPASAGHAGSGPGVLWAWGNDTAVPISVWEDASVLKVRGGKGEQEGEKARARHAERLVGSFVNN